MLTRNIYTHLNVSDFTYWMCVGVYFEKEVDILGNVFVYRSICVSKFDSLLFFFLFIPFFSAAFFLYQLCVRYVIL